MAAKSGDMSRPVGVTFLALLQVISGLTNVLTGMGILGSSSAAELPQATKSLLFWFGLILVVLGVSGLWLARGYLIGHEWARHRGRFVAILSILFAILAMVLNLPERLGPDYRGLSVLWNAVVYFYLGRPKIVAYFAGRWTGQPWSSKPRSTR